MGEAFCANICEAKSLFFLNKDEGAGVESLRGLFVQKVEIMLLTKGRGVGSEKVSLK